MFHLFRVFATVSLSPMLRRYNRLRLYRSYLVIIAVYPSNVFSSSSSFFFLFFPTIIEKNCDGMEGLEQEEDTYG